MLPVFFSNNQIVETLPLTDRSIHYGDGLFETIAVSNSRAEFIERHLARLQQSSNILSIPLPAPETIVTQLKLFLEKEPREKAVLKILVTRGSGGRGYEPSRLTKPRMIFALYPWPDDYAKYAAQGIKVFLCRTKLSYNESLAGMKHLNRLPQVMARMEFAQLDFQEGLMFDAKERLIEGTMSNVFLVSRNKLYTPEMTADGVQGIIKQFIMEVAPSVALEVHQAQITKDFMIKADEIFVCNSVMKIWPVIQIMKQSYSIGPQTKKLIRALNQLAKHHAFC